MFGTKCTCGKTHTPYMWHRWVKCCRSTHHGICSTCLCAVYSTGLWQWVFAVTERDAFMFACECGKPRLQVASGWLPAGQSTNFILCGCLLVTSMLHLSGIAACFFWWKHTALLKWTPKDVLSNDTFVGTICFYDIYKNVCSCVQGCDI